MTRAAAITPSKFTFDLDLGTTETRSRVLSEPRLAEMISAARAEGYAEGIAAGEKSVVSRAATDLTRAAEALSTRAAKLLGSVDQIGASAESAAVELATAVGRKLATHLIERLPVAELEQLITECLASLQQVPHLVIRCHPQLADAVRDIAASRSTAAGFAGRLIVMGEPDIALGDGRIEWVDGGLVRDTTSLLADIDSRITAYLDARGIARATKDTP